MKRLSINLLVLFALFCAGQSAAQARGGRTGNAGDWRREMIAAAQREGANWTNTAALHANALDDEPQNNDDPMAQLVFAFLHYPEALKRLASDIMASKHIYLAEGDAAAQNYHTCALTNDTEAASLSDVVFTLPHCEGGLLDGGQVFANSLVIHESVHHLLRSPEFESLITSHFTGSTEDRNTQEDLFGDMVARAIHQIFDLVATQNQPHWRDIAFPVFGMDDIGARPQALDPRGFHATVWTGATGDPATAQRMIVWGGCHEGRTTIYACGDDSYFNDGAIYNPADDTWTKIDSVNAPSPRAETLSLWTGGDGSKPNEMIVWGGCVQGDGCMRRLNDGGFYNPATQHWTAIEADNIVSPRVHHSGVWTGEQLIVWGGHPNLDPGSIFLPAPLADGGVYDPRSGWRAIPAVQSYAPAARAFHTAVWTGATDNPNTANRMLVWGGCLQEIGDACTGLRNDGALFDPQTMTWQPLATRGLAPTPRHNASVLYVPSQAKLYVIGGVDASGNVLAEGSVLDMKSLTWTPMARSATGRFKHRAVWAGDRVMIFGGKIFNDGTRSYELATGVEAYVPSPLPDRRGTWVRYETQELTPLKAIEHSAVWTGNSLIVWGGQIFDRGFTFSGSRFFPGSSRP